MKILSQIIRKQPLNSILLFLFLTYLQFYNKLIVFKNKYSKYFPHSNVFINDFHILLTYFVNTFYLSVLNEHISFVLLAEPDHSLNKIKLACSNCQRQFDVFVKYYK